METINGVMYRPRKLGRPWRARDARARRLLDKYNRPWRDRRRLARRRLRWLLLLAVVLVALLVVIPDL